MEDDNRVSYFFLGLGLGVAVGVLFAPKSGEETRDFLRSKAEEGTDYVKRRADDLRESAADAIDRGVELAAAYAEAVDVKDKIKVSTKIRLQEMATTRSLSKVSTAVPARESLRGPAPARRPRPRPPGKS